jgi:hypothetical protein
MALNGLEVMSAVASLFKQYVIKMIKCIAQFPAKIGFSELKIREYAACRHMEAWQHEKYATFITQPSA